MSANASCCATVDAELKRWDCWDRGDKKTSAKRNKDEIGTGWIMEIHSAGIWSQNGNRILGNVFRQKKIMTKIIGDTMDMKKKSKKQYSEWRNNEKKTENKDDTKRKMMTDFTALGKSLWQKFLPVHFLQNCVANLFPRRLWMLISQNHPRTFGIWLSFQLQQWSATFTTSAWYVYKTSSSSRNRFRT